VEGSNDSDERRVFPYYSVVFWVVQVLFVGLAVYAVFFNRNVLPGLLIGLVIAAPAFIKGVWQRHRYNKRMTMSGDSQNPQP
jgi:quinol-cytochrome oxidoreductase complex cytochrome b subunit